MLTIVPFRWILGSSPHDRRIRMTLEQVLPLLIPLVVVQLTLMVIALRDLVQQDRRVKGGDKRIWAAVIILGQLLGPLLYLVVGREES
jgi:hypothetical protein